LRFKYLYDQLNKNKIGEISVDIPFFANNNTQNLFNINGNNLLLLFYDYNCKDCKELIDSLKNSSTINSLIKNKELKIIAICTNTTLPEWIRYKKFIPDNWINGYDNYQIVNSQEYYIIQQLPAMFLLDKEKKLVLKDPSFSKLSSYLQ
jgi:hypothetical protein